MLNADLLGKGFAYFKANVKMNPFEVFSYLRNIINKDRPIRSAFMVLALVGGMAGGAALFVVQPTVNAWAISIVGTFFQNSSDVFLNICVGVFGAYIGNGVVGTAVKQTWRAFNKVLFGNTNSLFNLSAADLDAIIEANPELKNGEPPNHPDDFWAQYWSKLRYKMIQCIPMRCMPHDCFAHDLLPTEVEQDRQNLWELIQFVVSQKDKHKHDGTGKDRSAKYALKALINDKDATVMKDYLNELLEKARSKETSAITTVNHVSQALGEAPNLAAPANIDNPQRHLLLTKQFQRLKREGVERGRFSNWVHHSAKITHNADLNELQQAAASVRGNAGVKIVAIQRQLAKFRAIV